MRKIKDNTPNFYKVNAENYYAIFPQDEWEFEDMKDIAIDDFKAHGYTDGVSHDFGRMRDSEMLGVSKMIDAEDKDFVIEFELVPCFNIGYYEGAVLDYLFNIRSYYNYSRGIYDDWDGWRIDEIDEICDSIKEEAKAQYEYDEYDEISDKDIQKVLDDLKYGINKLVAEFEEIAEENSTDVLGLTARFSNGEAIYSRIDKNNK